MGLLGAAHGWGGEAVKKTLLPKISHKYPTVIKHGTVISCLKKTRKTFAISLENFAISRNADIDFVLVRHF